jgi:predicted transcriptional regulator
VQKRTLRITGPEALPYLAALASEKRLAILELLGDKTLNVQQISKAFGLSQPTVSSHIQRLADVGLIATTFRPGQRGTQKSCSSLYDEIIVRVSSLDEVPAAHVRELAVPVGAYTDYEVQPTCGLAHRESIIGHLDDARSFEFPERLRASILWFARGYVEYTFPRIVPAGGRVSRLDLSAEICSEVAGFDNDWSSDITLWVNGVDVGTWTSPGDFGGERGRRNPPWWQDRYTQFGNLKHWTIDLRGTYVDGVKLSEVGVNELGIDRGSVRIRLGNKPDARNPGGLTLFGDGFGNYDQDLVLRVMYDLPARNAVAPDEGGDPATQPTG